MSLRFAQGAATNVDPERNHDAVLFLDDSGLDGVDREEIGSERMIRWEHDGEGSDGDAAAET